MDEPISALDPVGAQLVRDAAHELASHGAVVVVAHHADTCAAADQILVLDQGRIVQQGTFEGLSTLPGVFQCLLRGRSAFEFRAG